MYANGDFSGTYVYGNNHTGDLCFNAATVDPPSALPGLQQNGTAYRVSDCSTHGKKVLMRMPIG